ncbi:hypothetical protein [Microbacterium sp. NPDC087589]|uniref:hypothetical protein n=1 Tax=Microbacterium sp. NPDC087589 TaxID=3364191 RepID=UPI0038227629
MRDADGIVRGRWQRGGMWVRGLCRGCNAFAGDRYDRAYASFTAELSRRLIPAVPVSQAPAIAIAPGRVARAMLSGMLGISPNIRTMHHDLAEQVRTGGPVRLPGRLALKLAVYLGRDAQLTGPMLTAFPLDPRSAINTLASVTFAPLSWALAGIENNDALGDAGWLDVTDWLLYEDDREAHDLGFLTPRGLPVTTEVLHQPSERGLQMYSSAITPILMGRIPHKDGQP